MTDERLNSSQSWLEQGLAAHRTGDLPAARALYAQARRVAPNDARVLNLSGVAEFQAGNLVLALEFFEQTLKIDKESVDASLGRGNALLELNRAAEALESYETALRLSPLRVDAHFGRGNALLDLGRLDLARASFESVIQLQPAHSAAHHNRGLALAMLGRLPQAIASFEEALRVDPEFQQALVSLGGAQMQAEEFAAAFVSFERAVSLDDASPSAHLGRGNALANLGSHRDALASFERAISLAPAVAESHSNLANSLMALGEMPRALESYQEALRINPGLAPAWFNLGTALLRQQDLNAAVGAFERAVSLGPGQVQYHNSLGLALMQLQRCEAARASFDRALALNPDFARARVNRALAALLGGDLEFGFREYEWRWRLSDTSFVAQKREFPVPLWSGEEPLVDKTLLLHAEQGYGDTLHFCRYASLAARLGARVILEVPEPLVDLLSTLEGVAEVTTPRQGRLSDLHAPLMSLPRAFKTTQATIPGEVPYLRADPRRFERFSRLLGPAKGRRVALVWAGGIRDRDLEPWSTDERRNVPLRELVRVLTPGIEALSLQKGEPTAELQSLGGGARVPILDLAPYLKDFADTAAVLQQVDLLISVDTAVAHLAGALGRPVWILNRFDTDWRWLLGRDDSPWYPTMRLYRQGIAGDWSPVIDAVARDLARWRL